MTSYPNFENHFVYALNEVFQERLRQLSLWGDDDFDGQDPNRILTIVTEEVGEIAKAILEGDDTNLQKEIAQVAALAVKWLEHIAKEKAGKEELESSTYDRILDSPNLFDAGQYLECTRFDFSNSIPMEPFHAEKVEYDPTEMACFGRLASPAVRRAIERDAAFLERVPIEVYKAYFKADEAQQAQRDTL